MPITAELLVLFLPLSRKLLPPATHVSTSASTVASRSFHSALSKENSVDQNLINHQGSFSMQCFFFFNIVLFFFFVFGLHAHRWVRIHFAHAERLITVTASWQPQCSKLLTADMYTRFITKLTFNSEDSLTSVVFPSRFQYDNIRLKSEILTCTKIRALDRPSVFCLLIYRGICVDVTHNKWLVLNCTNLSKPILHKMVT